MFQLINSTQMIQKVGFLYRESVSQLMSSSSWWYVVDISVLTIDGKKSPYEMQSRRTPIKWTKCIVESVCVCMCAHGDQYSIQMQPMEIYKIEAGLQKHAYLVKLYLLHTCLVSHTRIGSRCVKS